LFSRRRTVARKTTTRWRLGDCTKKASARFRRRSSFTIDGPDRVEAEDVPVEVTGILLGARYLYSVLVEGSTESEIPHALRFAKRLAVALNGAMFDQQTGRL
jgi:hypothetical protein